MSLLEIEIARDLHPVDVIEHVAHANEWAFERTGDCLLYTSDAADE